MHYLINKSWLKRLVDQLNCYIVTDFDFTLAKAD